MLAGESPEASADIIGLQDVGAICRKTLVPILEVGALWSATVRTASYTTRS